MNEMGEDNRLSQCPVCLCRVKDNELYHVRGMRLCAGCGRDQINEWNRFVEEASV
ncbi:MAG: hypothetical protein HRU82_02715 [Nitrospira sp.]|nr:MAG: hypothetical protein HRU82_02715 [Nitrospira sp.]